MVSIPVITAKIEEKETWTTEEEMFLPRTLEIKFGEEYSSVYYITIHVLLFYDDAKKKEVVNDASLVTDWLVLTNHLIWWLK